MVKIKYISVLVCFMSLFGCYQVSDADLFEDYEQKIVIEGQISNLPPPYYVNVSYSANSNDKVDYHPISNAQIIVSDNNGNSEVFQLLKPGVFVINEMIGIPGTKYTLYVSVNNLAYTATEVMPQPCVVLKSEIKHLTMFVSDTGNYIKLYIKKDNDLTNYYRLVVSKNDSIYNGYNDLIIFDDAFANDTVKYLVPYVFMVNDTVDIDLHAISYNMYKYYYALNKQTNNTFSNIQTPLKNPPTNVTNSALGYFHVSSVTQLELIIE